MKYGPVAVAEVVVRLLAALRKDRVREVVVLVDETVYRRIAALHAGEQDRHLLYAGRGGEDLRRQTLGHTLRILLRKAVKHARNVSLETVLDLPHVLADHREIEVENEILAALISWIRADFRAREELVEPFGVRHVVVRLKYGKEHRLAEPARTQEYGVPRRL